MKFTPALWPGQPGQAIRSKKPIRNPAIRRNEKPYGKRVRRHQFQRHQNAIFMTTVPVVLKRVPWHWEDWEVKPTEPSSKSSLGPQKLQSEVQPLNSSHNDQMKLKLIVRNLCLQVSEESLEKLFLQATPGVKSCTLVPPLCPGADSTQFGFVEFINQTSAEVALISMNGRHYCGKPMKVSWAGESNTAPVSGPEDSGGSVAFVAPPQAEAAQTNAGKAAKDSNSNFQIFIGNVGREVTKSKLLETFFRFGPISQCKLKYDLRPNKNNGFGFVSFVHKADATLALAAINGQFIGRRSQGPVRTAWAVHGEPKNINNYTSIFERVFNQTALDNRTVACKMICGEITTKNIHALFSRYGRVHCIAIQPQRRLALITFETKAMATVAITSRDHKVINNRPVICDWAKEIQPNSPTGRTEQEIQSSENSSDESSSNSLNWVLNSECQKQDNFPWTWLLRKDLLHKGNINTLPKIVPLPRATWEDRNVIIANAIRLVQNEVNKP